MHDRLLRKGCVKGEVTFLNVGKRVIPVICGKQCKIETTQT